MQSKAKIAQAAKECGWSLVQDPTFDWRITIHAPDNSWWMQVNFGRSGAVLRAWHLHRSPERRIIDRPIKGGTKTIIKMMSEGKP